MIETDVKSRMEKIYSGIMEKEISFISELHEVTVEEMKSRSRLKKIMSARVVFSMKCYDLGISSVKIGRYINRDHATILHYLKNDILRKHYKRIYEAERHNKN